MSAEPNIRRSWHCLFLCLLTSSVLVAQVPQNPPTSSQEEVVRVYTELVQTDVMVFDKQGHFVNGLTRNDFQLKVDGKPRPIQAFDLVTAGSNEEIQLAAARGGPAAPTSTTRPIPLDRGRTVFFYLDDFHLNVEGFSAARKILTQFVENDLGQNDQVAIVAASGQVGFLQQLTNNRTVLSQAIARLNPRQYSVRDSDRPPMGEYESLLIDLNDLDVFDVFVTETLKFNPGMSRQTAEGTVRARAQGLISQAGAFTNYTFSGLERLVRSMSAVPGRKVLFLLSNGFFIQNRRGDALQRLKQITAAAARSGVVIYSLDVRGLVGNLDHDLSADRVFDTTGRMQRAMRGELAASQDGLNALARDTGGRPFFNTNDFREGVRAAVKETSVYYLLAWKPDLEQTPKAGRFRNIEVTVVGRPDLTVRVRRGFFDVEPTPPVRNAAEEVSASKQIPAKLRETLIAPFPQSNLPLTLNAFFHDTATKGSMVAASVQIPGEFMTFGPEDGKIQAIIDLSGVYYNVSGNPVISFLERIVTTAPDAEVAKTYRRDINYTYPASLKPGLYQVRVAARDDKSGRIGSAFTWIEVPDLTKKELAMSSLILAERTQAMMTNVSNPGEILPIMQSGSQRFRRQSNLRFVLFTYNTQPSATDGKPDVAVQVQVLRDNQPVITTALRRVNTEGVVDLSRLPYAAEVSLNNLTSGQYVLQVTVIDRLSKQSSTQQTHFEVY